MSLLCKGTAQHRCLGILSLCQKHGHPAMKDSLTHEGWSLRIATRKREIGLETCVPENRTHGGGKKRPQGCGQPEVSLSSLLRLLRLVGELGFG